MAIAINRREWIKLSASSALAGIIIAKHVRAADNACGGMSREDFDVYVDRFNANDPGFIKFYHPEVVLELGSTAIKSPKGILNFYAGIKKHLKETLEVTKYISNENGIAIEANTTFKCFNDWNDGFWGRPLKNGEVFRGSGFVHYELEDGKFIPEFCMKNKKD